MPLIVWRNRDLNTLKTDLEARGAGGQKVLEEIITDVADEAVDRMKKIIETVPSGIVPGKIGRIDTGLMHDSVNRTEVASGPGAGAQTGNKVSVKVGWTGRVEDYFLYQEYGADNAFGAAGISSGFHAGGRRIPPMHALLGAFIWAREELKQRIEALVK